MDYSIITELLVTILVFLILFAIGRIIYRKLESNESRFLNPYEYFPEDEVTSLKQVFYLIMMLLFFIFILYSLFVKDADFYSFAFLEIIVLLYITITLDFSSWKNRLLFILLIPYGSIALFLFGEYSFIRLLDLLHVIPYIFLIKLYYRKFKNYTETNSLGITIILLFSIVAISFIITLIVENTGPLNALVMVSNAFTSNGYTVLGTTSVGKLNSIFLVWGGYILSGVGTATLTAAILIKHFNNKFDEFEKLIKENNEK